VWCGGPSSSAPASGEAEAVEGAAAGSEGDLFGLGFGAQLLLLFLSRDLLEILAARGRKVRNVTTCRSEKTPTAGDAPIGPMAKYSASE
jgi:hypothetical protein